MTRYIFFTTFTKNVDKFFIANEKNYKQKKIYIQKIRIFDIIILCNDDQKRL